MHSVISSNLSAELDKLNSRQREAVTHPDGPLLVVAGPGTGKTQLLAARVAWLLATTDTKAHEILCLTYTDAAAQNMRQRLQQFIGLEAHRVAIHTFHSLGQLLIQENAHLLERDDFTPASELEVEGLLRRLLDELPSGHPLRRTTSAVYYDVPALKTLFQAMKREGWNEAQLRQALEEYRQSIQPSATAGKALSPSKRADLELRITKAVAAVELLAGYQSGLQQERRYDYDDMLAWAIALLTQHEHVRLSYQERFQHFLVDEFQDTNGAQSQLLYLLANYWENPNVLVVGDDDQSIFRFQGACVANILEFTERFPSAKVVVLEENYRSSAAILAAAQGLITRNQERLTQRLPGLVKALQARHARFADSPVRPRLLSYASPLHEAAHVAQQLAAQHAAGWPTGGVGVLVRTNGQLELLATLLRAAGIPFQRKRKVNVLREEGLASSLRRVLDYLAAALQANHTASDAALFVVLHLPCFEVPSSDLVRLAAGYKRQKLDAPRDATPYPWSVWAEEVTGRDAVAEQLGLSSQGRVALQRALAQLQQWVRVAASQPLPVLLEQVVQQTLLPAQLVAHPQPAHLLAVARTLLAFGRQEARRQPGLEVSDFLRIWDLQASTKEGLPLEQSSGHGGAALELSTVHSAKGLEWEQVWMVGCQASKWQSTQTKYAFLLPPALVPTPNSALECEEARRLFFVGLTRAQVDLRVSWAEADENGKGLPPSQFVQELASGGISVESVEVEASIVAAAALTQLTPPPPAAPLPAIALLEELMANFTLSATVLNAYLRCPISCYYEHLLGAPQERNEHLLFGVAVHAALEQYFRRAQREPERGFGTSEELEAEFARRFQRHRDDLPAAVFTRLLQNGQDQLRAWWARWHSQWQLSSVVEYKVVRAVLPEGIALTGKVDRLDLYPNGRTVDVLDYKTGASDKHTAKLKAAPAKAAEATLQEWHADEQLRGTDYWRQAVFYHLLLAHDQTARYQPAAVKINFLRPVSKPSTPPQFIQEEVKVTPEAIATVRAQIAAVDTAIRAYDFSHGCGKCRWCDLRQQAASSELPR